MSAKVSSSLKADLDSSGQRKSLGDHKQNSNWTDSDKRSLSSEVCTKSW